MIHPASSLKEYKPWEYPRFDRENRSFPGWQVLISRTQPLDPPRSWGPVREAQSPLALAIQNFWSKTHTSAVRTQYWLTFNAYRSVKDAKCSEAFNILKSYVSLHNQHQLGMNGCKRFWLLMPINSHAVQNRKEHLHLTAIESWITRELERQYNTRRLSN